MDNIKIRKRKQVAKGETLLSHGDIATYAYRVESGCLKSYVIDNSGKEHILQFAPEGWLISDVDSFTNNKPTVIFIEAIENSEVSFIGQEDYRDFSRLDKDVLIEMSKKYRNNMIATHKRIIALLSATAEERYVEFTETYPTLVQRLPLKLIASYIGITPEYLSDLRRKIAKK
ncbi:Crp/Fnr family transcriptional regulator [Portibacter lacus]|uniref:cAMP-binding protein n=1 Tax=Portibacter lacus TaxID=1099794 RepID=A0AA37WGG4_9BACT|nr:Crp/Fnr family transcriptional regulator [Portibacter lacus]GLR19843.1 cAMP-binding protein [Portibacter lacus]